MLVPRTLKGSASTTRPPPLLPPPPLLFASQRSRREPSGDGFSVYSESSPEENLWCTLLTRLPVGGVRGCPEDDRGAVCILRPPGG